LRDEECDKRVENEIAIRGWRLKNTASWTNKPCKRVSSVRSLGRLQKGGGSDAHHFVKVRKQGERERKIHNSTSPISIQIRVDIPGYIPMNDE
jgi:hypothetical protein